MAGTTLLPIVNLNFMKAFLENYNVKDFLFCDILGNTFFQNLVR